MRANITSSSELLSGDFRMDASYHASSGRQAIKQLTHSDRKLERLDKVCLPGGVYIPARFKRIFVDDAQHGAPYITGGSIMLAEPLLGAKFLSYRYTSNVNRLALREKMILMTCSGEIGNTVYVNEIFLGSIGSPDLLRILADPEMIPTGYLYAYLSSFQARALIQQKTYGAVIPHIEAHHIADLPVPRLDPVQEEQIHQVIERAANLRSKANHSIQFARELIGREVSFLSYKKKHDHSFTVDHEKIEFTLPFRLDSFYLSGYCAEALNAMDRYSGKVVPAKDVGFNIDNPPLFKRQFAQSGYPYMSGVDFFNLRPHTDRYLSKNQQDIDLYLVRKGMVLMQSAGQRYGLITTPLMVTRVLDGVAVTSDVVRINHKDLVENGYICALFGSGFGRRLALRYSYGTSIPRLDVPEFSKIKIPWPQDELRRKIGQIMVDAYQQYDLANELEDQAQALLLHALIV